MAVHADLRFPRKLTEPLNVKVMERDYCYRGYVINVLVENYATLTVPDARMAEVGCAALVSVFKEGQKIPLVGPMRLCNSGAHVFSSEIDALFGGCSAGQRAIDDLAFGDAA